MRFFIEGFFQIKTNDHPTDNPVTNCIYGNVPYEIMKYHTLEDSDRIQFGDIIYIQRNPEDAIRSHYKRSDRVADLHFFMTQLELIDIIQTQVRRGIDEGVNCIVFNFDDVVSSPQTCAKRIFDSKVYFDKSQFRHDKLEDKEFIDDLTQQARLNYDRRFGMLNKPITEKIEVMIHDAMNSELGKTVVDNYEKLKGFES